MNIKYIKGYAIVIIVFFCFLLVGFSQAQCLKKLALEERMGEATVVIEGKVLFKKPVWNAKHTKIYTLNTIEVFKVFKGAITDSNIVLVTEGGMLDGQLHVVDPELNLEPKETGIFILKAITFALLAQNQPKYMAVGATQGFIKYDNKKIKAFDISEEFNSRDKDLYPRLIKISGKKPFERKPLSDLLPDLMNKMEVAPVIKSFFPTSRKAGVFDTLTIQGSGFGANLAPASVQFPSADNAGKTLKVADQILLWRDTLIKVIVPSRAGTGNFVVTTSASITVNSPQPLTILYNLSTVSAGGIYRPSLINSNGSGGYTFLYSTYVANKGISFAATTMARAKFESALKSWKCNTGYNINISGTTTSVGNTGADGVNIIAFDNDSFPLPKGVLGLTYSYYSGCNNNWWLNEMDIIFKRNGTDSTTWYYGDLPNTQKYYECDFESVSLHELGHSHGLGHVIKLGAVMHFTIVTGTQSRVLDTDRDVAAGKDMINFSSAFNTCQKQGMKPLFTNPIGIAFSNQPSGGSCTGISTANVTGGTKPYSYAWNDKMAQKTSSAKQLCPGTYKVRVMDTLGCSLSAETTISLITGIAAQMQRPTLQMHPNPVDDHVNVYMNVAESMSIKMELYNAMGALIDASEFSTLPGTNMYRVDMSRLSLGVYYMNITSPEEKITRKLLKL